MLNQILSHKTDDSVSFELGITDGQLNHIQIVYSNGETLNRTALVNGKIVSLAIENSECCHVYNELETNLKSKCDSILVTNQDVLGLSEYDSDILIKPRNITHKKNGKKSFEFDLENEKLIKITIYHRSGELFNIICLTEGKITSYKIYKKKWIDCQSIQKDTKKPIINKDTKKPIINKDKIHTEICIDCDSDQKDTKNPPVKKDVPNQSLANKDVEDSHAKSDETTVMLEYELSLGEDGTLSHCKYYHLNSLNLCYEGGVSNGVWKGYGKKFYIHGFLMYEGNWADNLYHGEGTLYFENGNVAYSGFFRNGQKIGKGITYFESGNKCYEGQYYNDNYVGEAQLFHPNGNLYLTGRFDFYRESFSRYGFIFMGTCFNDLNVKDYRGDMCYNKTTNKYIPEGLGIKFWPNGNKKYSGSWVRGTCVGNGTSFYPNGNICFSGYFRGDLCFHGIGSKYDESGILMVTGLWKDGQLENIFLTDKEQIDSYSTIVYDNYIYVGKVIFNLKADYGKCYQRSTGMLVSEGNFQNDKKTGLWKIYYASNKNSQSLRELGYKDNGELHGPNCTYHQNGRFLSRTFYKRNTKMEKFQVCYKKNGKINLNTSYKGDLFLVSDFQKECL